jgi:prepilin-type N-terminal cleavage/methylation domain-containing protein
MASGAPPVRRAFTLTELLIVIAIIAVLAGLLIPAANMVRQQANTVKCTSNMRQIAMAVEVYVQNANGSFPDNFPELVTLYTLPPKVLLCPSDPKKGTDPNMGREPAWGDLTRLWYIHQNTYLPASVAAQFAPVNTSYDFEASGTVTSIQPDLVQSNDISFFYFNLSHTGQSLPALGSVSWADCKQNEQQFGNGDANNNPTAFPASAVPIMRCYNHWDWVQAYNHATSPTSYPVKVNNISMEFNQIWTTPYWETGYNPNFLAYQSSPAR